jgi:hypothetical protein
MATRLGARFFAGLWLVAVLATPAARANSFLLGAVETPLLQQQAVRPASVQEINKLRAGATNLATLLAAALPGEIVAIPQAQPSNALFSRTVRTNWTVFAYDAATGSVVPNVDITLGGLRHQPLFGGHNHDSAERPKGSLSAYRGNTGPLGLDLNIQYISPEVSGTVYSDAACTGPNGFACFPGQFCSFTTMVPGLVGLPDATYYKKVGIKDIHPASHFGTASFISKLQAAAITYYNTYIDQTSHQLAINDISLPTGGLFDVETPPKVWVPWNPPHGEHRVGRSADIRLVPVDRRGHLRVILRNAGILERPYVEPSHWHVRETATRE